MPQDGNKALANGKVVIGDKKVSRLRDMQVGISGRSFSFARVVSGDTESLRRI